MKIGILIEELKLSKRIAHEGYPPHEALYQSVKEYEEFTQTTLLHSFCDNCGYANGVCPSCASNEETSVPYRPPGSCQLYGGEQCSPGACDCRGYDDD